MNGLDQASVALFALCQDGDWTTDDPLGVGGLLFDACRLCQLIREEQLLELCLLEAVIKGCRNGLMLVLDKGYLKWPSRRCASAVTALRPAQTKKHQVTVASSRCKQCDRPLVEIDH
jgi:hypothetical protein